MAGSMGSVRRTSTEGGSIRVTTRAAAVPLLHRRTKSALVRLEHLAFVASPMRRAPAGLALHMPIADGGQAEPGEVMCDSTLGATNGPPKEESPKVNSYSHREMGMVDSSQMLPKSDGIPLSSSNRQLPEKIPRHRARTTLGSRGTE